jgi:hypothetical protein
MPYFYLEFVTCDEEGGQREGRLLESYRAVKDVLREFQGYRFVITELVVTRQVR